MRSCRNGRKVFFAALVAVAVVFVAFAAFANGGDSPEYALRQAAKAVFEKDDILFAEYVDADALFDSAYDESAAELSRRVGELHARYPDDPFFWHDTAFMTDYTLNHKNDAMNLLQGIRYDYFNGRLSDSFDTDPAAFLANETQKFIAASSAECVSVEENENDAVAVFVVHGDESDYGKMSDGLVFRIALKKQPNGAWKICRVANVGELVLPITDSAECYWILQNW